MTDKEKIKEAFYKVKALGFVTSHRRHNTGIGKTFEDYMGVVENNLDKPDLFGFEIKSHRMDSASYVTLFTRKPSNRDVKGNDYLKNKFGDNYPDSDLKKLHTSVFADSFNAYCGKYSFRLEHDREQRRVYVCVYTLGGQSLIDKTVYYTYNDIEKALTKKLHSLFYVKAQREYMSDKTERFYFESAEIYTHPTLSNFLDMLDKGEIRYDIRIGTYQSGPKLGKPHDHGSCFRVKESNIHKLYSCREEV